MKENTINEQTEVKVETPEEIAAFEADIENYEKLNAEYKRLEKEVKALGDKIKAKLKAKDLHSYVTLNNIEASLVDSVTQSFDSDLLLTFLKANNKQYLIKETPLLDAVKSEIKNKIISEEALSGIRTTTVTTKLYVKPIKE